MCNRVKATTTTSMQDRGGKVICKSFIFRSFHCIQQHTVILGLAREEEEDDEEEEASCQRIIV